MKVTKRNGNVVIYDDEKLVTSILKANADAVGEELDRRTAMLIADEVFSRLTKAREIISTGDVRVCVEELLREKGYPETARCYQAYKK